MSENKRLEEYMDGDHGDYRQNVFYEQSTSN